MAMIIPPNGGDQNDWNNYYNQQRLNDDINRTSAQKPIVCYTPPSATQIAEAEYLINKHPKIYFCLRVFCICLSLSVMASVLYVMIPNEVLTQYNMGWMISIFKNTIVEYFKQQIRLNTQPINTMNISLVSNIIKW